MEPAPSRLCAVHPWRRALVTSGYLALADLAALGLAFGLAAGVRHLFSVALGTLITEPLVTALPLGLIFFFAFALAGLYPSFGMPAEEERRRASWATLVTTVVIGMVLFLLRIDNVSRFVFVGAGFMATLLVPLARSLVRIELARRPGWGRPVAIVGSSREAAALVRALKARPMLGLDPVAVLVTGAPETSEHHGVPVLGTLEADGEKAGEHGIRHALIAVAGGERGRISRLIRRAEPHFARTTVVPYFLRLAEYQLAPHDYDGLVGLSARQPLAGPVWSRAKRFFDFTLTLALAPLALPVLAACALAIRLDSPGPVLFRQARMGRRGRTFQVLKLRTMYEDAEARLQEVLSRDPALAAEYEKMHKLEHDPRVTRPGRVLRRYSLDELPQLWNVLRGEMSLVGPRPYMPEEREQMGGLDRVILRVRPGMTGYWQIFDRNRASFHQRLQMDVHYVRNGSPWIDLFLLVRTIGVLVRPRDVH